MSAISSFLKVAAVAAQAALLAACGASVDPPTSSARAAKLQYVGACTPSACDGLPTPAIACADASKSVDVCAPGADGACGISLRCDGGGGSAGGPADDGTVSFEPCADSACGAVPMIGCADDATMTQLCGKENAGACQWFSTCAPKPGALCDPKECGDAVPAVAPICSDGTVGSMVCRKLGGACGYASSCE